MPLIPLRGVVALIDRDENEVVRLAETGDLLWCWDVSARPGRLRHEWRFLPECVAAWMRGSKCELDWPEVLRLVLPEGDSFSSSEIVRALNICGDHFYNLAAQGHIEGCSERRRGPGGAGMVPAASVIKFLRERRYP